MAITIDPANKRLILDSTSVTAQAIYAAWVDWVALADNAKYPPAFRSAGGDDLGGGLLIPAYYFLLNGWRARPMEADQTLTLTGNLFVDGGGDPVVSTLGDFNVLVKNVVPVQAQGISTSGSAGPSAEQIAVQVRASMAAELTRIIELAKVHGLLPEAPLVVTPTSRTAGDVVQTVNNVGTTTTVTRQ